MIGMATKEVWTKIGVAAKNFLFLQEEDRINMMKDLLECCDSQQQRGILSLFYIYGMRPAELLTMVKADFSFRKNGEVWANLPTAKTGNDKRMDRIIILDSSVPFMNEVMKYLDTLPYPNHPLIIGYKAPTVANKIIDIPKKRYEEKTGQKIVLTPYVFRKFRLSWLFNNGANLNDILAWKGGRSLKPLETSYLFTRAVGKFKNSLT